MCLIKYGKKMKSVIHQFLASKIKRTYFVETFEFRRRKSLFLFWFLTFLSFSYLEVGMDRYWSAETFWLCCLRLVDASMMREQLLYGRLHCLKINKESLIFICHFSRKNRKNIERLEFFFARKFNSFVNLNFSEKNRYTKIVCVNENKIIQKWKFKWDFFS